jgi:hypothetical protein
MGDEEAGDHRLLLWTSATNIHALMCLIQLGLLADANEPKLSPFSYVLIHIFIIYTFQRKAEAYSSYSRKRSYLGIRCATANYGDSSIEEYLLLNTYLKVVGSERTGVKIVKIHASTFATFYRERPYYFKKP